MSDCCFDEFDLPSNVDLVNMPFDELKEKIQSKFDFKISLNNYGRISQFRPALAYIFPEIVEGYDYWGFIECDLIYGDIRHFITDNVLESHDKIFKLGHFQIFRNNDSMNTLFMRKYPNALDYRFAFSKDILFFEELIGMQNIADAANCKTYENNIFADVRSGELMFNTSTYGYNDEKYAGECLFEYTKGKLYKVTYDKKICRTEILYAHLQKRDMEISTTNTAEYLIVPNRFLPYETITEDFFQNIRSSLTAKANLYRKMIDNKSKEAAKKRNRKICWWQLRLRGFKIRGGGVWPKRKESEKTEQVKTTYRIAIFVLYFGKLPDYTQLFLNTAAYNPTINFRFVTDQDMEKYKIPENVMIESCTFEQIREKIQFKFDFKINLEKPYKLCDYRPAYGYIFEDELSEFDFWGHCDLDIVLGDLRSFLREEILEKYEKIYQWGHLCLYKNSKENNRRFTADAGMNYRKVFSSPISYVFDEIEGIQKKFDILHIPTYKKRDCADISPWHYRFVRAESYVTKDERKDLNYKKQLFYWEDGKIYRAAIVNHQVEQREFSYLHFQKRNIIMRGDQFYEAFYITRDGIIPKTPRKQITEAEMEKQNGSNFWKELIFRINYHKFIWKRRLSKYFFRK